MPYDLHERLNWQQACILLGCKKDTFYCLINDGKLPSYGVGQRFRWVRRSDCERLLVGGETCSKEVPSTCHSPEESL